MSFALNESKLAAFRRSMKANETGETLDERFRPELPWKVLQVEPKVRTYTNKDGDEVVMRDERTYRFFGGISAVTNTNPRSGKSYTDLDYDNNYWAPMLVLGLFAGLAPVPNSVRIPRDLYQIPVADTSVTANDYEPLAWALNPPKSPQQRKAQRADEQHGVLPQLVYWACVHVQEPSIKDPLETYEFIGILQLKNWQAKQLAERLTAARRLSRMSGAPQDFAGVPLNIWDAKSVDVKNPELIVETADGDTWDMGEIDAPDFDHQANAMRSELDRFLVENHAQIAGFPGKDDHVDDGWRSNKPAYLGTHDAPFDVAPQNTGGLDEFKSTKAQDLREFEEELTSAADSDSQTFTDYSEWKITQLRERALEMGIIAGRSNRERLISLIEEKEKALASS